MRHFEELEKEEAIIGRKLPRYNRYIKFGKISTIIIFISSILILLEFSNRPSIKISLPSIVLYLIFILLFISLSSFFIFNYFIEKYRLSLRQSFLHQINTLRKLINNKGEEEYLKILREKTSFLEFRYGSIKKDSYNFDIEKDIDNFFGGLLFHLKFYSKKDYLNGSDIIALSMFFDLILERILKENFTLEGLALKKPQKKLDLPRILDKIKESLRFRGVKIICLLVVSFLIILFFRLIGILKNLSLEIYFLCASLVFIIYFGFFDKKNN